MSGLVGRGLGLLSLIVLTLSGCAGDLSDAKLPPGQPLPTATHFRATVPGQFPVDVYLSAWGEGYVIHTPGEFPLYLIRDKDGGYILQSPGAETRFVVERPDGSGWTILSASEPATLLLKQKDGGWLLQPPGALPTLIQPD